MPIPDIVAIITATDGGFNGDVPAKLITVTPLDESTVSYTLTTCDIDPETGEAVPTAVVEAFTVTITEGTP